MVDYLSHIVEESSRYIKSYSYQGVQLMTNSSQIGWIWSEFY